MKLNVLPSRTRKQPWYAAGLQFTCTQCGNCCTGGPGYVWITRDEIARLAEFLNITPDQTVERYCRKIGGRFSLNERRNGRNYDCIFLKEEKLTRPASESDENGEQIVQTRRICRIYPVRPLQCRTWPFWPENLRSERVWNLSARRCPGMNTGRSYTQEQIESIRDAEEWPDRPPDSSS